MAEGRVEIATLPSGSSIEWIEGGKLMMFLPDGSAQMIELVLDGGTANPYGLSSRITSFPPIKLR